MKRNNKKYIRFPKNMTEAKELCISICEENDVKITFDDKWKNYGSQLNSSSTGGDNKIDCSIFSDFNHDLLVFAVLHELGHIHADRYIKVRKNNNVKTEEWDTENRTIFSREFEAWDFAIKEHNRIFGQNISIKMARFMMDCLGSYIPDYNGYMTTKDGKHEAECSFWCPMKKRIIR